VDGSSGVRPDGITVHLRVRGVVQGVGFRPFVYRLARDRDIAGWVTNDAEGVLIEASGAGDVIERFARSLRTEAPPAARVDDVIELHREPAGGDARLPAFRIRESDHGEQVTTLISPDLPVCDDCLRELFDEGDRRYRYPFINCTNCGPRYTIIQGLPYDRPLTTMRAFALCEACAAEYHDPRDRRFHAQPVACPVCGPLLTLHDAEGAEVARGDAVVTGAADLLRAGRILAVKGLGGYHLACDAQDSVVVDALRERKFRKEKPFALMAAGLDQLRGFVHVSDAAARLLTSPARPVVLLPKGPRVLPESLAPGNADLGVMLPYTPFHHLLFAAGAPRLLVMTSANRSSEPIAYRDDEALERLAGIADAFVVGERPIERRVDDSVVTLLGERPAIHRRARGYAPGPVASSPRFETPLLGLGAGLKNTVTLAVAGRAFMSQHLGDLDHYDAFTAFEETVRDLTRLYRVDVGTVPLAHDLHPDYPSTRFAGTLHGPAVAVQHHAAHIASVLAERGAWERRVLGFAFDGAGLGSDDTIWGGEVFVGSLASGLERVAHLRPAALPGGDAAARTPPQAAVGFLHDLDEARWRPLLPERVVRAALGMVRSGVNTPTTTSVGRLFDTVAAVTGFVRTMSFEGQAAMQLEGLARTSRDDGTYPLPFDGRTFDHRVLLGAVLDDLHAGAAAATVARRFHRGLSRAVVAAATELAGRHGVEVVCLSGGVWQNRLLFDLTLPKLRASGLEVWWNEAVPLGDGGVSLGQVALAAAARG
jgi:hydrogenase maturation protein HypF